MPRTTFWRVALSFLWIASMLAGALSALIEVCKQSAGTNYKNCAAEQAAYFMLGKVADLLNSVSPALTALATFAIAAFTYTLWQSTDRLWLVTKTAADAAEKSANVAERALTDLERPYLFILDYNWLLIDPAKVGGRESGLVYSVANGGKLPAFIKGVKLGIRIGGSTPPDMDDEPLVRDLLTAPLIGAGEQRTVIQGFTDESSEAALECQIRGGMAVIPGGVLKAGRVIAKIAIEYDGPITSGHETTACWEWHPVKYAFTQYGGPEHNQRT
jgi:hypothetical protein